MYKSVQGVDGGIGFELGGYFNSMNLVQIYVTDIILYITTKLFKQMTVLQPCKNDSILPSQISKSNPLCLSKKIREKNVAILKVWAFFFANYL